MSTEPDLSPDHLQERIDELRRMIQVSGIAHDSLMWKMLKSSLAQIDRAVERQDWQTVEQGLQTTRTLLLQCTI